VHGQKIFQKIHPVISNPSIDDKCSDAWPSSFYALPEWMCEPEMNDCARLKTFSIR